MTLVPVVRCSRMADALDFYTRILDFDHVGTWPVGGDPAFTILVRRGHELHLSSHGGDGQVGQAIAVLVDDIDTVFERFRTRGLDVSAKPGSPVHQAPLDQSWGTREFYADDPDGNTLRFVQR